MPDTYVIFICDLDPFGKRLYKYEYEMKCEQTGESLRDGTHTVFLSTKGTNDQTVSEALKRFLKYVGNPDDGAESTDAFVQSLEEQIRQIKKSREWSNKYMLLEIMLQKERREGQEEGRKEGLKDGQEIGRREGQIEMLAEMCCNKLKRGLSRETIIEQLEGKEEIAWVLEKAQEFAPDYNVEQVCESIRRSLQKENGENKIQKLI